MRISFLCESHPSMALDTSDLCSALVTVSCRLRFMRTIGDIEVMFVPTWAQQAKQPGCIDRHESRATRINSLEEFFFRSFYFFTCDRSYIYLVIIEITIYSSVSRLIFYRLEFLRLQTIFIIYSFSFNWSFLTRHCF